MGQKSVVFFTEICGRGKFIKDNKLTQKCFNEQRRAVNSLMKETIVGMLKIRAAFPQHYYKDLVHFNDQGYKKFFYDIKKVIFSLTIW